MDAVHDILAELLQELHGTGCGRKGACLSDTKLGLLSQRLNHLVSRRAGQGPRSLGLARAACSRGPPLL